MLSTSAMANSSLDVLDKISNSAEVRNLVGNSFLIHVKYISSNYSGDNYHIYELKSQKMDSPHYFCSALRVNNNENDIVEVVKTTQCRQ